MARKYVRKEKPVVEEAEENSNVGEDISNNAPAEIEDSYEGDVIVESDFTPEIKQTVSATGTVKKKILNFSRIVLLKDVAGMKGGSLIDILDIDDSDNVYFKIGDIQTFFTATEKGRLWKFYEEK